MAIVGRSPQLCRQQTYVYRTGPVWEPVASGSREGQGESGSFAELALDSEISAHSPREIPADRQSKTRSFMPRRVVPIHLDKGLEDRVDLVGWNSGAVVDDNDADPLVLFLTLECDVATARG